MLSVSVACDEGSYVVSLNGLPSGSYVWSRTNESDCMVRSGLSGYTQWFVMQWPTADLVQTVGGDNVISIGMSQPQGASDDALRLELTNTSAAPSTTGWNDYTFISPSPAPIVFNNDAVPKPVGTIRWLRQRVPRICVGMRGTLFCIEARGCEDECMISQANCGPTTPMGANLVAGGWRDVSRVGSAGHGGVCEWGLRRSRAVGADAGPADAE